MAKRYYRDEFPNTKLGSVRYQLFGRPRWITTIVITAALGFNVAVALVK